MKRETGLGSERRVVENGERGKDAGLVGRRCGS